MSTFEVTVRKLSKVLPHTNADKLELAEVEGLAYQFVIPKGQFKVGDDVAYFPIDSVMPDSLSTKLGIKNYLAGKEKNRVKTAKLRGMVSQGVVARPDAVIDGWHHKDCGTTDGCWTEPPHYEYGVDYAPQLGVTKYDPPPIVGANCNLGPLPPGVSEYDIESCDYHPDITESMMDQKVYITEKIEGQNWSATIQPDGTIQVSQRSKQVIPTGDVKPAIWAVGEGGLFDFLKSIAFMKPGHLITIRGEYVGPGVQKNIYKLQKHKVLLFDIEDNCKSIDAEEFIGLTVAYGVETVPELAINVTLREWLAGRTVREASNGKSLLADTLREGIVIKPMTEQRHNELGRLFLKQRSPEYLAETDF